MTVSARGQLLMRFPRPVPSLPHFRYNPIIQSMREHRQLFQPLLFVREYDDDVSQTVHGLNLLHRLPRDVQVIVVLPTDWTISRAVAEPIVATVCCQEDEAIRPNASECCHMAKHVARGVQEVE